MDLSPATHDEPHAEPLWDLTPHLDQLDIPLSPAAEALVQAAEARTRDVRCFDFVPSNYRNAWCYLSWLATSVRLSSGDAEQSSVKLSRTQWFKHVSQSQSSQPIRFVEWGSGLGVVTGLAYLLGFEATGIELDEPLTNQSRQLLGEHACLPTIQCGSYFEHHVPADIYYVYAWPSQRAAILELFMKTAPAHALFILCDGQDLLRVLTRWP